MAAPHDVKIGVIGGTGLYKLDHLEIVDEIYPDTPWGKPSSKIVIISTHTGLKIAFLARHGEGHIYNPSEIPSRANIAALKYIGVQVIIAFSAVGSLREEIKPRDFVLPVQVIDRTKGIRPHTFFENGIAGHASFADPFNEKLGKIIASHASALDNATLHLNKTLVCMEGPAFSTRAESNLYRSWGCDVINMSCLPEAKLAREAEIAYQMVCMSTDYDCWKTDIEVVTVDTVIQNLRANGENAKKLLVAVLGDVETAIKQDGFKDVRGPMKYAVITDRGMWTEDAKKRLEYLLPGYYT
ncbi:971_t:CDS:2 [Paraglomus occultum]|uniref:S-methyl-5'-thioadenosine phosphorylase n=1 Tax=Paraglomus occultum TaxID=144539 RepID=A0A9N9CEX0_9GLOM|nr:971_t:CDS:2 [Paraglomus occultum]